jgi:hypothetical protein
MIQRFIIRPHREAFALHDTWTGEPATIGMTPQTGLSEEDAAHTAEILNRRAADEAPPVLQ